MLLSLRRALGSDLCGFVQVSNEGCVLICVWVWAVLGNLWCSERVVVGPGNPPSVQPSSYNLFMQISCRVKVVIG